MDRISCIAFLLFNQSSNEEVKNIAIKLAIGDVTIKELKRDKMYCPYIKEAEKTLKKAEFNRKQVCQFIEKYIYADLKK